MIVYGASLSPFVRKALVVAAEKGIEVETQLTIPGSAAADFVEASPFRKIPALRDGDFTLCDSTAIVTYLDALHPEPPMLPSEPRQRAKAIWFEEFSDTIMVPSMAKMFFNRIVAPRFLKQPGDEAAADLAEREELPKLLTYLEGVVPDQGFLVGDRLSIADIAVASPFMTLQHLGVDVAAARYPKTRAWVTSVLDRPSFARLLPGENALLAAA